MLQRRLAALVVSVIPPTILIPVVIGAAAELLASELPARELSEQELPVAGDAANHFSGYRCSVKVNVKNAIALLLRPDTMSNR
jgi:hypothetical protein